VSGAPVSLRKAPDRAPASPGGLTMSAPPGAWGRPPRPMFGGRWRGPVAPPSRAVLVAVAVAGLAMAIAVPEGRAGLGFLVAALVAVVAVLAARWSAVRNGGSPLGAGDPVAGRSEDVEAAAPGPVGAGPASDGVGADVSGSVGLDSAAGGATGATPRPVGAGPASDGVGADVSGSVDADPASGRAGANAPGSVGAGSAAAGAGAVDPGSAGAAPVSRGAGAGSVGAGPESDGVGAALYPPGGAGPAGWGLLDRPAPVRPADVGWTLAALALAAVPAVRAAEWLAALCLLAALAAAALAVAGRSFRGVPAALFAAPAAMMRAVPWLGRGVRGGGLGRVLRTGVAALVGLALLLLFGSLLASADAAFAQVVDDLLPRIDGDSVTRWVVLYAFGTLAAAGACFLLLGPPDPATAATPRPTRLRCLDWALPTGLLVGLFGLFVGVQFVVLFGGADHVLRTTGLTYAEYARSGFWQLLAVTVLALGVLAVGSRWAPAATVVERAWKRGLLGTLANLTLIIVVSAINRMWLYQQAYGFTVLRLLVLTCELWLGVGFVLALVAVLRLRPAGLTRPMVAAGMIALLGLAVLNPERFVAEHNVARWVETGRIDASYLGSLSADALPPLAELPEPMRSCVLAAIAAQLPAPDDDWRSANLARATARNQLASIRSTCPR
jgi:hypothetical protein